MALNILFNASVGRTLFATLERLSDGFYWNPTAVAWQNNPSTANKKIDLPEGTGINVGSYPAVVPSLGDAGYVRIRIHDDADAADRTIGGSTTHVVGGNEVPFGSDANGKVAVANNGIAATSFAADSIDSTALNANAAAKIWASASRTLTAFGFTVTVDKTGYKLAADGLDSVVIESGITLGTATTTDGGTQVTSINVRQALSLVTSISCGVVSGGGTGIVVHRPISRPTAPPRNTTIVDGTGNRTSTTIRVPD